MHGHQGDTIDVGIALTSNATTHRGLYVGVTRGRDENRIDVITEHDDLIEARDVLDGVVTYDRADISAITQRRLLADAERQKSRPEPMAVLPDWVEPWRQQLHDRRQLLVDGLNDREQLRAGAVRALQELHPALESARAAWEPHARRMRDIERELQAELRPAMARVDEVHRPAGLGRRRNAQRHAAEATGAVQRAEAAIATIHADGKPIREHLDQLQHRAATLRAHAEPAGGPDTLDRRELHQLDQILDAVDTYTNWLEGQPTPTARLAQSVTILSDVAKRAPFFAHHPGQPDKTKWYELLELAQDGLQPQLSRDRPTRQVELGR